MKTQDIKTVLFQKLAELNSRPVRLEDIAIEKTAEEMDEIQQICEHALAINSISRKCETTALVSEALQRIENDTYGTCDNCDELISPKRLAAIPWAKYCISCQEIMDNPAADMRWDHAA